MNWFQQLWNSLIDGLPIIEKHVDVTGNLPAMAIMSLLAGLGVALVILVVLALLNSFRHGKWSISGKWLTTLFCVTWLFGFILYDIGIYTGEPRSFLLNAPMAMIHAFDMFFLQSDAAALHHEFHENVVFMGFFSFAHLLAAFVSMVFVIKHFGFNIIAGFKMLLAAYFFCKKKRKDTYVFWGLNEPSYLLAKSIKQYYEDNNKKKDYRIIVVRTGSDGDRTSVRNGMERMLNFLSLKNKDLERLQDLGCLTTSTFVDVSKLNIAGKTGDDVEVLKKQLNLRQLSRILSHKTTSAIHLFFLGNDASANIQSITNLKKDSVLLGFAGNEKHHDERKITFYCHARYNSVHRVIEDEQLQDNIEVKVVDSSHISIEQLKQDVSLHPVSYVDIENDATVSSPFNALVVGFGEVGIDAVRFLYEFGTFVKHGTVQDGKVERSDFHCDVVDSKMPVVAGPVLSAVPAIISELTMKDGTKVVLNSGDGNGEERGDEGTTVAPLMSLHELDMLGVDFYKKLDTWVKTLNYVVIATDDDEQNMALAVRIFKLAIRYRPDLEHFRILVCVKSDNDGHIRRTAEHYNRLWAAEKHSTADERQLHQKKVKNEAQYKAPITVFGMSDMIYTYDYIISDRLVEEAKSFKERYDASIAALRQQSGESTQVSQNWDAEYKDLMQLVGEYKDYSPTYTGMMRLRRIQSQNRQNCFHLRTKQELARQALGEEVYAKLSKNILFRKNNEIEYKWKEGKPIDKVVTVLDVLAMTEHLRWCASHEILGYRDQGDEEFKDEARLQHGCLKPWDELSDEKKSYDYNIVDVSLGIISE